MVYNPYAIYPDGVIFGFNPLTNTWFFTKTLASPGSAAPGLYHHVAAYSAVKNVMVYGGGNSTPNQLWKMDSAGTVTTLTPLTGSDEIGIQHGNLVCDPVSGNFLVLTNDKFYELNPNGTGTWTLLTGTRLPPDHGPISSLKTSIGVGVPGPNNYCADGIVSCPIPEYGVVAYITQSTPSGPADGRFYLYKHA
jgi:hypothetical protein